MVTPNTVNYMVAGYSVIFGGLFLYIFSLIWRTRRLHRELLTLNELSEDN